jgi:hypothetical protein
MKTPSKEDVTVKERVSGDVWIARLADLLRTIDAMEDDERAAAFNFLKSKYSSNWPRDSY